MKERVSDLDKDSTLYLKGTEGKLKYRGTSHEIAKKEDEVRNELKGNSLPKEKIDKLGDRESTNALEIAEGKKELEKTQEILKETKQEVLTDSLTGLWNRKALEGEITREISSLKRKIAESERRKKMECSFLMIDIDNFKKINDTYGHPAGDKVIKELASIMTGILRKADFAGRWGGEEFAILLPDTGIDEAMITAERIRKKVEETKIPINQNGENLEISFGISAGVMPVTEISGWKETETVDVGNELMRRADVALYTSKNFGRNRTTRYNPSMEERKR